MKFNVDVVVDSSGLSGFNFQVHAESYLGAMIAALNELDKRKITENQIDSLNISVNPF